MEKERCPRYAKYLYSWAGKLMRGCEKHANGMAALSQAIGSPIDIEELTDQDIMCSHPNDLEEAAE